MRKAVPGPTEASVPAGPAIKLGEPTASKDPRFIKVIDKLDKSAQKTRKHPPASKKALEAQAAAVPPLNEKLAGAQAIQVKVMREAETRKPESESFLSLMRAEIEKAMPKNLGDTEKFMKGEKKDQLKVAMTGNVDKQKEDATGGIKSAASERPDPTRVPGKEVTPVPPEPSPPAPQPIGAAEGMPATKPATEVSLENSKQDVNRQLIDANVTPSQLQKANDPRFSAVLAAKSAVETHADAAPKKYEVDEQKAIAQSANMAIAEERKGLAVFLGIKGMSVAKVKSRQQMTKEKDEAERKKVSDTIENIYRKTKETVEKKLSSLEAEVSAKFDQGMEAALKKMTDHIDDRMFKWKLARYGGSLGLLWLKDKLLGLPDEVNVFYENGRKIFTHELDRTITDIAKLVDARLKEAKDEISKGQKEIGDYVEGLPQNLQAVGRAAEKDISGRFDELSQSVDDKKNDLAQNLAQRYKEANDKANEKLKEMKDANKGLVTKLKETLGEVVKILREFKARIMGMLKQSETTILLIVADPIAFLKNLLNAIKKGISQFVDRIWEHLKAGFMAWLFGSLAEAGVEVPKDFSLGSILKLVLQVLGLTYERIRAKAVKLIGERNVGLLEKAFELIKALITGGPEKLWEMMKEYLGNLKEMIVNAIQDWVVTTVIKAAVTKLISMFNPVGAIIQAILAIYNTVMFFIERIRQILDFVEAIVKSIFNIATGAIGTAADWIEKSLARTIPIIIAFLARLLGITGITEKIVGIIKKIQLKVDEAVDKVIGKIVGGIGKLVGMGKTAVGKIVEWWKLKKVVSSDGQKVTVSTEGSEDSAKVLIASSPSKIWSEYLKDVYATTPKQKDSLIKAKALAAIIEKKRTKATTREDHAKKVNDSFNELAEHIKILNDAHPVPASVIVFKGTNPKGGAIEANASILSKEHPVGSPPNDYADIWNDLKHLGNGLGRNVRKDWYVQGHLLNEHLGGPGMRFNLTPITKKANNEHKSVVETELKQLVNEKGKVISYTIKALDPPPKGRNPRRTELEAKSSRSKDEDLELKSLQALGRLTHGFRCTAYLLEKDDSSKKWKKKGKVLDKASITIDNNIEEGGKTYGY
jgi:hypothetical protein